MAAKIKDPAPLVAGRASKTFAVAAERLENSRDPRRIQAASSEIAEHRMSIAGDALADAARLIVVHGILGESAARQGDEAEAFARFRAIANALDEAREIVRLAGSLAP